MIFHDISSLFRQRLSQSIRCSFIQPYPIYAGALGLTNIFQLIGDITKHQCFQLTWSSNGYGEPGNSPQSASWDSTSLSQTCKPTCSLWLYIFCCLRGGMITFRCQKSEFKLPTRLWPAFQVAFWILLLAFDVAHLLKNWYGWQSVRTETFWYMLR